MTASRGLVALDLDTGEERWRSTAARRPLTWTDDTLAGLDLTPSGQLQVVLLGLQDGREISRWAPLTLPPGIDVSVFDSERFQLAASLHGRKVELTWLAQDHYRGGAPPGPGVRLPASKTQSGRFTIDSLTGRIEATAWDQENSPQPGSSLPYLRHERWCETSWLAVGKEVALGATSSEANRTLKLSRLDLRSGLRSNHELTSDAFTRLLVSAEGRFLFVDHAAESSSGTWSIFSIESGQRLTEWHHEAHANAPAVIADSVFYLVLERRGLPETTPIMVTTLVARDLERGGLRWQKRLEERAQRPPSALRSGPGRKAPMRRKG